jgi:hypothetical protein
MQSVTELLDYLKQGLEDSKPLETLAVALKIDEPGTSGKIEVVLGNEFFKAKTIPPSKHPFVIVQVGDEKDRKEYLDGNVITREFRFIGGILDNKVERCTRRLLTFEETLLKEVRRLLQAIVRTPDEAGANLGLIRSFDVLPIIGDADTNRPAAYSAVPVRLYYVVEE